LKSFYLNNFIILQVHYTLLRYKSNTLNEPKRIITPWTNLKKEKTLY